MKIISYKIVMLFFAGILSMTAQQKLQKTSKSIDVNKDVTINLNTSFANIEFESWNKNVIEVEAYIESTKLSKEELQKALDAWDLSIEGYGDNVSIKTNNALSSWSWGSELGELAQLASLESLGALENISTIISEMPELPEIPAMPEFPEIPEVAGLAQDALKSLSRMSFPTMPRLPEGVTSVNFDTVEYKERGEAYLDEWSSKFERKYGEGYGEKMKVWARNFVASDFESKMEEWGVEFGENFGEDFGKKMEAWGEEFGEKWGEEFGDKMEKWGEEFGEKWGGEYAQRMEAWGESLDKKLTEKYGKDYEQKLEERAKLFEERVEEKTKLFEDRMNRNGTLSNDNSNSKIKKTIKIKMPKGAKLKVNVRHGELKFASSVYNLKADLSHSKFLAKSIDGENTSINAAYSSIFIKEWKAGELDLDYVQDAIVQNVEALFLNSNSSSIGIDYLKNSAIINGSFGDLTIHNIMDSFTNLNIILENSDAHIKLPKTDYDLLFRGNRSKFNNESTSKKVIKNYPEGGNSNKTIMVNAKYSNVVMQ